MGKSINKSRKLLITNSGQLPYKTKTPLTKSQNKKKSLFMKMQNHVLKSKTLPIMNRINEMTSQLKIGELNSKWTTLKKKLDDSRKENYLAVRNEEKCNLIDSKPFINNHSKPKKKKKMKI